MSLFSIGVRHFRMRAKPRTLRYALVNPVRYFCANCWDERYNSADVEPASLHFERNLRDRFVRTGTEGEELRTTEEDIQHSSKPSFVATVHFLFLWPMRKERSPSPHEPGGDDNCAANRHRQRLLLTGSRRHYARSRQRIVVWPNGGRRRRAIHAIWLPRVSRPGGPSAVRVGGAWRAVAARCTDRRRYARSRQRVVALCISAA